MPSGNGNASATYNSGTINVFGNRPRGIVVWVEGDGSASVTTSPGTVITVNGSNNPGVDAPSLPVKAAISVQLNSATAANGRSLIATVASQIMSFGTAAPDPNIFNNPVGIRTLSYADAPSTVIYTGPGITTQGGGGAGIMALSASGNITVNATGPINTTNGSNAVGILADSGTILAQKNGLLTDTTAIHQGAVVRASTTGSVQVNAANVSATGQFGTGISATSGTGGVAVNIASGGSVMGGWQADLASIGPIYGLQANGIFLSSTGGTATLTNGGSIGALSDRAVAGDPNIINNGIITGFVQLAGTSAVTNNGLFDLRHFADTNGDGIRDTLRVAVSDLGGPSSTFVNNGTLALLGASGATTLDSTGQFLPLGLTFNTMALGGPVQGQILGATTFSNTGTIDLQANPVPGDVLLISGGHTPGTTGGGTFIASGGRLLLDTVLNEGGPASRSDVLVVDGTSVDAGGATKMTIRNAGGAGALTVGDGILVVQVLDLGRSAPDAFALATGVEARGGAFDYDLFHGGVGGSNPSDWFLRSTFIVGPVPPEPPILPPILPPEPPPGVLPPGVYPIIGPEIATYGVVQPIARQLGMTTLGTLDDRIGDTSFVANTPCRSDSATRDTIATKAPVKALPDCPSVGWAPSAWGRVLGQQIDNRYRAFADPRASGQLLGFQSGIDLWHGEWLPGHRETAGIYFAYANADVGVNGLVTNEAATAYVLRKTGNLNLDAWSGAAYWTHRGPTDWYLDAVAQVTRYEGAASTQFASLATTGFGFVSSLEAGYPIPLSMFGPGFVLEPQAQIIWQHVSFDDANDGLGEVALGTTSGASGRIGLRGRWTIVSDSGQVWQPYLRANLWRDWGAQATTTYSGVDLVPLLERASRLQLGGGLSVRMNTNLSLYANADYQFAVGDTDGGRRDGIRGAAGVRYTW